MPNSKHRTGSCRQARSLLSAQREWTPQEQAQAGRHLAGCPACQAVALEYELMDRRLGRLPEPATEAVTLSAGWAQRISPAGAARAQPVSWPNQIARGGVFLVLVAAIMALALVWSSRGPAFPVGWNVAGPKSTPFPTPTSSPPPAKLITESFAWPAPGILTQGYSEYHRAVDIANQPGTPVRAITSGTVIEMEEDHDLHGTYVLLGHSNGYRSFYSHLSLAHVQAGEDVVQGQEIGLMGRTGLATGPHLHFEIRRGGSPVDPFGAISREVWKRQLTPVPGSRGDGSGAEGYVWPVRGVLNQGYSSDHPALDIGQYEGAPVRAIAAGQVTLSTEDAQNGIHILLEHRDGLTSFYSHLSLAHVEAGEWVALGEEIGLVGNTGISTGPHLHLQIRRHGEPVNPLDLLPHVGE